MNIREALTYENVLSAVQNGENPTEIVSTVQLFLQQNPNLSESDKAGIANAVQERNKLEKQKSNQHGAKRMRLVHNLRERPWLQLNLTDIIKTIPVADNFITLLKTNPADVLKWICLSRQSLQKIERDRACGIFNELKKLLVNCLVRVSVNGDYLVEEIQNVKERVESSRNVHSARCLVLSHGHFEFHQISDSPPTEAEIQQWIQRRGLPEVNFLRYKIKKLKRILGGNVIQIQVEEDGNASLDLGEASVVQASGEGTSSAVSLSAANCGGTRKSTRISEMNLDARKKVHSLDTLIQSLLPNELFFGILNVRNKFAMRADTTIGCLVAYKILGDPENRVYISEIAKIDDHSVHFKHRPAAVEFVNLLPVVEQRDVDEDAYGKWHEEINNWNEPLPELYRLTGKLKNVMDILKQTLQSGPPLDMSVGYTHRDLLVRPEQIGQLWSGLDRQEFAEVITGMFVNFDLIESNCTIATVKKAKNFVGEKRYTNANYNNKHHLFMPISKVTFDAPVATPVPFLPTNCTSNALLHIDPGVELLDERTKEKVTALPIPRTEELLNLQHFKFCYSILQKTNYAFPSMEWRPK